MKNKRNTQVILSILGIIIIGVLVASNDNIREEWRMRKIARQLEASTLIMDAYGSEVSVSSLARGVQAGTSGGMWISHCTPFRVIGEGVDKTIWVNWRHSEGGLDAKVQGIVDKQTSVDIPAFANP